MFMNISSPNAHDHRAAGMIVPLETRAVGGSAYIVWVCHMLRMIDHDRAGIIVGSVRIQGNPKRCAAICHSTQNVV